MRFGLSKPNRSRGTSRLKKFVITAIRHLPNGSKVGSTNLCHNAIDRHLEDRGDQAALIFISTETDQEVTYTYKQLHAEVQRMAASLLSLGVKKGDRVLIYMPMIAEASFAMLACARIGAIHSVVFGGFASGSLASRIEDASPKVIVSADAGSREIGRAHV